MRGPSPDGISQGWTSQGRRSNAHALTTTASDRPTILLVLLSLLGFPFPWLLLFPGVEQQPPEFILYSGIVGLVVAVGLWMMKAWSYWATIVVCVLNFLLGVPSVGMAPAAAIRVTVGVLEVVAVLVIELVVLPSSRRALATADQPSRVR